MERARVCTRITKCLQLREDGASRDYANLTKSYKNQTVLVDTHHPTVSPLTLTAMPKQLKFFLLAIFASLLVSTATAAGIDCTLDYGPSSSQGKYGKWHSFVLLSTPHNLSLQLTSMPRCALWRLHRRHHHRVQKIHMRKVYEATHSYDNLVRDLSSCRVTLVPFWIFPQARAIWAQKSCPVVTILEVWFPTRGTERVSISPLTVASRSVLQLLFVTFHATFAHPSVRVLESHRNLSSCSERLSCEDPGVKGQKLLLLRQGFAWGQWVKLSALSSICADDFYVADGDWLPLVTDSVHSMFIGSTDYPQTLMELLCSRYKSEGWKCSVQCNQLILLRMPPVLYFGKTWSAIRLSLWEGDAWQTHSPTWDFSQPIQLLYLDWSEGEKVLVLQVQYNTNTNTTTVFTLCTQTTMQNCRGLQV